MVMTRMSRLVKAYIHEGLEKLEDPVVLVKQYIRDMRDDIKQMEIGIEKHIKLDQTLAKDWQLAKDIFDHREHQASVAIQAENDDLARVAIISKKEAWEQMTRYEQLREMNNVQIIEKKQELSQLQYKYEQLRDRKLELMLRVQAVRANKHIKQLDRKYNQKGSTLETEFERMEERVDELGWATGEESRMKQMNKRNSDSIDIQEELDRMKQKLAQD